MEKQRVAIVTGASRGIGAAMAQRLAQDGFAVVVNYARGREEAEQVVAAIEAQGGHAVAVQADIGETSGAATLFDTAEQAFGGVDVLVNNAGTMKLGALADVADADFDRQVALNLGGVFRGMREAARRLRDGGRIISFSSSVVGLYQPGYGVYAATKAAVEAMTHILAKELGPRGITVNAVAPGPVETRFFLEGKSDEQVRAIKAMNPLKRLGQPEDIAGVVAFLASPEGGWVNGQVIRANGGVI
ncbi:MAG: SDR family oxidoreductase [Aquamicrobium sp.]|uniref:SDR family oxidoreductase n=1 Tax=Mesorhizobium sp. Pch-S TaxID=2082387 RepID=UPI001010437B|nr:SDR family oxidoreductase [Mesorhizobium sp. Pch-S]MBR2691923.1 SDR family oxidoreductase [Aquamicrobium sp.]QAZ42945.1 3-ketoacyl-ACP reductase [Mesorhizobium sp. Pch-S]